MPPLSPGIPPLPLHEREACASGIFTGSRLNGYFAAVEAQELYEEGRRGIGTWAIGSGDRGVVIVLGWSSRLDAGARARGLMAT